MPEYVFIITVGLEEVGQQPMTEWLGGQLSETGEKRHDHKTIY